VRLYVVRHAHAGGRSSWDGDDGARPLSRKGQRQADGIADQLADAGIHRLLSSPALRCVQTLQPLAERLGLPVEDDARLEEGARLRDALALAVEVRAAASAGRDGGPDGSGGDGNGGDGNGGDGSGRPVAVALCSHGDVIPELIRALRDDGVRIDDPLVCPKASTWVFGGNRRRFTSGRYLAPPVRERR
jgi:8-oxo-dGTP diphosphatase